jgi:hypothetical protein
LPSNKGIRRHLSAKFSFSNISLNAPSAADKRVRGGADAGDCFSIFSLCVSASVDLSVRGGGEGFVTFWWREEQNPLQVTLCVLKLQGGVRRSVVKEESGKGAMQAELR